MRASLARDQDVLIDFKALQQVCRHALKVLLYSMCTHMSRCLGHLTTVTTSLHVQMILAACCRRQLLDLQHGSTMRHVAQSQYSSPSINVIDKGRRQARAACLHLRSLLPSNILWCFRSSAGLRGWRATWTACPTAWQI